MKRFSQKQTDVKSGKGGSKVQSLQPKNPSILEKTTSSRFTNMSHDLERIQPLHIPGYKTRG